MTPNNSVENLPPSAATAPPVAGTLPPAIAQAPPDPREGDPAYEQARLLMTAIDDLLNDVAEQRSEAKKLPGKDEFLVTPIWTETKEDREDRKPAPERGATAQPPPVEHSFGFKRHE